MAANYVELGTLLFALFLLYLLLVFIQNPMAIIINSLVAIGILFLLNAIFHVGVPITIVTVGIVALGGLVGLLLVLILHYLGVAFLSKSV